MCKQAKTDECVVNAVNALLVTQHTFLAKTKAFMESNRRLVSVDCLTANFVQIQRTKSMRKRHCTQLAAAAFVRIWSGVKAPIGHSTGDHVAKLHIPNGVMRFLNY